MPARKPVDEIPRSPGIYQIVCKPNGQMYVGSAVDVRARWYLHRRSLRQGTHHSAYLRGKRKQPPKQHAYFIAPGGAYTIITNLNAFCRACDLRVVHMHDVKSGKRPSHKGWTWRKPDENQTYQ
jgi:hypothetical protein